MPETGPPDRARRIPAGGMLVPCLLAAALIALRNPAAVFRAEFWAEDGTEFFRTALAHGASSLVMPVYGYNLLLARCIAFMATLFPVLCTPYIYAATALAFNALTVGYLSREGFAWLIPRRGHRILVGCLLTLAPGAAETFLNISNLTNCLALLALLMLIEKPRALSWPKFAALVLIGLSSGHMVILLPLILYLWYRSRDRRYLYLVLALVPIVAANMIGNQRSGAETGLLDYSSIWIAPRAVLENFLLRLFFAPFLGSTLTGVFMKTPAWVFWPLSLGALAAAVWGLRRARYDRDAAGILGLSYLLAVGTFGIIVISRSYAVSRVFREHGDILWGIRYSFLPGVVADLIWLAVFIALARGWREKPWLARLARVGILLVSLNNLARWHGIHRRGDARWPESARSIQAVLDQRARGDLRVATEVDRIRMHPMGTPFEWLTVTIPPSP
jgi:hypothetical protein